MRTYFIEEVNFLVLWGVRNNRVDKITQLSVNRISINSNNIVSISL